jgi:hypothetical protein
VTAPEPGSEGSYRMVTSIQNAAPTRSIAMAVANGRAPRPLRVTAVGPGGSEVLPERAVTRSRSLITVALGDRTITQVHLEFGRGSTFDLSEIWTYPSTIS